MYPQRKLETTHIFLKLNLTCERSVELITQINRAKYSSLNVFDENILRIQRESKTTFNWVFISLKRIFFEMFT